MCMRCLIVFAVGTAVAMVRTADADAQEAPAVLRIQDDGTQSHLRAVPASPGASGAHFPVRANAPVRGVGSWTTGVASGAPAVVARHDSLVPQPEDPQAGSGAAPLNPPNGAPYAPPLAVESVSEPASSVCPHGPGCKICSTGKPAYVRIVTLHDLFHHHREGKAEHAHGRCRHCQKWGLLHNGHCKECHARFWSWWERQWMMFYVRNDHTARALKQVLCHDHRSPECKFGYFIPSGNGGSGTPLVGGYSMVYPLNPHYTDPRDMSIYAAQGYGVPMTVPLAPVVQDAYNYSWGIPSSRLTPVSRTVP